MVEKIYLFLCSLSIARYNLNAFDDEVVAIVILYISSWEDVHTVLLANIRIWESLLGRVEIKNRVFGGGKFFFEKIVKNQ